MISNVNMGVLGAAMQGKVQAKQAAASKQGSDDFQKTLLNVSAQNMAQGVTGQVASNLVSTVSRDNVNKVSADDTKTVDTANKAQTATETANTKSTTETKNEPEKESVSASPNTTQTEESAGVEETAVPEKAVASDQNPGEEVAEAADDALGTALLEESRRLMEMLSEQLDISIEDIEKAMATLGLTQAQILEPANLTMITAELTGAQDMMAIVTNADLYMSVQDMQDAVTTAKQDLMEQFSLSEEEFGEELAKFGENLQMAEGDKAGEKFQGETPNAMFEVKTPVDLTLAGKIETNVEETVIEAEPEVEISVEEAVISSAETGSSHSDTESENNENADGSLFNQIANQISSSLSEVSQAAENVQSYVREDAAKIMEQITEFIKINVREEATTMELQLHPASLGTVNVMIEQAKQGNMIAKFITQNEDVRAIIESQLQQLQEKFNEQGVKVTEVQVTVNAGGFDQTLNDSQSQKDDDQDAQQSIRKPMRRINLGDLSLDAMEDIDEGDLLTAEMMAINGNLVDFSA